MADIGAGTGLFLETFRDAVGQEGSVYAVELSEAFCANLKVRADEDKSGAKVEVVRCTDTACNLPEASVDVAFICDVYHHFEYPKTFMRSLVRWEVHPFSIRPFFLSSHARTRTLSCALISLPYGAVCSIAHPRVACSANLSAVHPLCRHWKSTFCPHCGLRCL